MINNKHYSLIKISLDTAKVYKTDKSFLYEFSAIQRKIPHRQILRSGEEYKEYEPHITVVYGIENNVPAVSVVKMCKQIITEPIRITIGKIDRFRAEQHDVLIIRVISPDLIKLNTAIRKKLGIKLSYNEYCPHITLAYVNKDTCRKIDGMNHSLLGDRLHITELTYVHYNEISRRENSYDFNIGRNHA